MLTIEIPGRGELALEHLLADLNGTLTRSGSLIDGVAERIAALSSSLSVTILSADTFGALASVAGSLGVEARTVASGEDKRRLVNELGPARCVAIGNGANDRAMIETAELGIAVVGPEGAAVGTVLAADVVCVSITDALDLLIDPRLLVATLRT